MAEANDHSMLVMLGVAALKSYTDGLCTGFTVGTTVDVQHFDPDEPYRTVEFSVFHGDVYARTYVEPQVCRSVKMNIPEATFLIGHRSVDELIEDLKGRENGELE